MKFFGYFKDGAVIQRCQPFTVRGFAEEGQEIVCSLCGGEENFRKSVVCKNGRFAVTFEGIDDVKSAYTLTAECGKEKVSVKVRFGDVYLALGQSNMSYSLSAVEGNEEWIERAKNANVAFLNLTEKPVAAGEEMTRPVNPLEEFISDYDWVTNESEKALIGGTSALCVQVATELSERQEIPVAFVQTAMGGLSLETYLKREVAESDEETLAFMKRVGRYVSIEDYNRMGGRNYTQLAGVWNEKISPLLGMKFKAIVWYLGESSAWDYEFGYYFLRQMKTLVHSYRADFGDIPFVAVHIAPEYYPYGDRFGYLYINEALTLLQKEVTDVISVPIYDIEPRWLKPNGDLYFHPIHPVNKAPVAGRIAAALDGRRTAYPEIAEVRYEAGKAVCRIAHADSLGSGVKQGFTLAGANGKYYPAHAEVTGRDEITVTCADVAEPKKLTYAFLQYQDFCDVKDADGAPLLPYRTDVERIDGRYCFPPAYTVNGKTEVYENNFGWQVGTCRKAAIWKEGGIYDGARTEIESLGDCVSFTARPTAENYFFFGVSPAICLAGHKHHIADFRYWNVALKADGKTDFYGVVVRTADGNVYRFDLLNGDKKADFLPLFEEFTTYTVCLYSGLRGDSAPEEFSREFRESIVEAEFLFRSRERTSVCLKDLTLSDIRACVYIGKQENKGVERGDIKLPESSE